jgi:hypothetical protein
MIRPRTTTRMAATAVILFGCLYALAGPGDPPVPFPKGYRKWVHVKSTVVTAQHSFLAKPPCEKPCVGGIFHFYANQKALEGYRTGAFPDGSMIADDLHELKEVKAGGPVTPEGALRVVSVMVKDRERYRATGGWGYESWNPGNEVDGALTADEKAACYTCHIARKDHDYVFTEFRE